MTASHEQRAGQAFIWKAFQFGGERAIYFFRLLVLTWLLSPDDFGLLAIAMVAVEITAQLTEIGLVPALIQRKDITDTHYHTAWTTGIIRAIFIGIIIFFSAPYIAFLFNEPRAALIIKVLSVRPLLEAAGSIKIVDINRNLDFRKMAFIKIPEAIISTITAISLAPFWGVWALVASIFASLLLRLFLTYYHAPYRPKLVYQPEAARSLIQFGRWIFIISLIDVFSNSFLKFIITRQLGTSELGIYYLAVSLAFLPSEISSTVIGEVSFPLFSKYQAHLEKLKSLFQSVLKGMYILTIPVCCLIIALAPALVENALGAKWAGTVPIIRILTFASIIGLLGNIIGPLHQGIGQPFKVAVNIGLQRITLVILIWLFTAYWGLNGAALAWLPAIIISQIVDIFFMKRLLEKPFHGTVKTFLIVTAISTGCALMANYLYHITGNIVGLLAAALGATAIIFFLLILLDERLSLGLKDSLVKFFPRLPFIPGISSR